MIQGKIEVVSVYYGEKFDRKQMTGSRMTSPLKELLKKSLGFKP